MQEVASQKNEQKKHLQHIGYGCCSFTESRGNGLKEVVIGQLGMSPMTLERVLKSDPGMEGFAWTLCDGVCVCLCSRVFLLWEHSGRGYWNVWSLTTVHEQGSST